MLGIIVSNAGEIGEETVMNGSRLWPITEAEKLVTRTEASAVRASYQKKHYMKQDRGASFPLCGAVLFKTREEAEEEARKWRCRPGFSLDPKGLSTIRVYVDLTSETPVPDAKKQRA